VDPVPDQRGGLIIPVRTSKLSVNLKNVKYIMNYKVKASLPFKHHSREAHRNGSEVESSATQSHSQSKWFYIFNMTPSPKHSGTYMLFTCHNRTSWWYNYPNLYGV
jgi:hypothetical protein